MEENKSKNPFGLSDRVLRKYPRIPYTVVFKSISSQTIDPRTIATGNPQPYEPVDIYLAKETCIYPFNDPDPQVSRNGPIFMLPIKGRKPTWNLEKQEQEVKEVIEDVVFTDGILQINPMTQYELYLWACLHPQNASNPWKDLNKRPLFSTIEPRDIQISKKLNVHKFEQMATKMLLEFSELPNNEGTAKVNELFTALQSVKPETPRHVAYKERFDHLWSEATNDPEVLLSCSVNKTHMVTMAVVKMVNQHVLVKVGSMYVDFNKEHYTNEAMVKIEIPIEAEDDITVIVDYFSPIIMKYRGDKLTPEQTKIVAAYEKLLAFIQ
jgi:hypothetical protein